MTRRSFLTRSAALAGAALLPGHGQAQPAAPIAMTVRGPVDRAAMGTTLVHEHILVWWGAAADFRAGLWDREAVAARMLPYLERIRALGCRSFIDCTPAYLGRDPLLLRLLAERSGLNILTNTGYYGGAKPDSLPAHAFTETPRQLADRWIAEWRDGIEGTGIRPGFIKISVNDGRLSAISQKLVRAAALAHLETGLTIVSHTGPAIPAFQQIALLREAGVSPTAFVWVHAQSEPDRAHYLRAAAEGAWVSLDGLSEDSVGHYLDLLGFMKANGALGRTLISQDAGWYKPGEPEGGEIRGYATLFERLVPALRQAGFTAAELDLLLRDNPWEAHAVRVRRG